MKLRLRASFLFPFEKCPLTLTRLPAPTPFASPAQERERGRWLTFWTSSSSVFILFSRPSKSTRNDHPSHTKSVTLAERLHIPSLYKATRANVSNETMCVYFLVSVWKRRERGPHWLSDLCTQLNRNQINKMPQTRNRQRAGVCCRESLSGIEPREAVCVV